MNNTKTRLNVLIHLFVFLLAYGNVHAQENKGQLLQDLLSVNPYWTKEKLNKVQAKFSNPKTRQADMIQLHLQFVEQVLRSKDISHLSKQVQEKRKTHLTHLRSYWQNGDFPINSYHSKTTPYFVDDFGTHCAVGHLLSKSGEDQLVQKIKSKDNYAYIDELAVKYPEVVDWASANGYEVEELAWIQPGYPARPKAMYHVGNGGAFDGSINVMEVTPDESLLIMGGSFTVIDDVNTNSIIGWDGEDWVEFGDGVEGEVFDIHFHNDRLVIAGNFKIAGEDEYSSIAFWANDSWISLQEGVTGNIYAMETFQGQLYIGGAFQYLDGEPMPYLAYYDETSNTWSNAGLVLDSDTLKSQPNMFSVDDTVRCLKTFEDILFVGGDFLLTSPSVDHPNVIQHEVRGMAQWHGYIWQAPRFDLELYSVNAIQQKNDSLLFFGPMLINYYYPIVIYHRKESSMMKDLDFWVFHDDQPPLIYGYLRYQNNDFFYGNIMTYGGRIYYGSGLYGHTGYSDGLFDDQVVAATVFQDQMYFAGDFDTVFYEPYKGLARSYWEEPSVSTKDDVENSTPLKLYVSDKTLFIDSPERIAYANLRIYTMSGQLVETVLLDKNLRSTTVYLNRLDPGLYTFQLFDQGRHESKLLYVN